MLHDLFCRITKSYSDASGVIRAWSTRVSKMVVYEHVGEKTQKAHIHILVLKSSVSSKQLRNIAANYVNVKGNENCSFKTCNDEYETALIYMTKGNLNPVYLQGYTLEDADGWKSRWKQYESHIATKRSPSEILFDKVFDDVGKEGSISDLDFQYWLKDLDKDVIKSMGKTPGEMKFIWLKGYCKKWAFSENHFIWNMKTVSDYKMLLLTYCMRFNVSIPSSEKDWNKYF